MEENKIPYGYCQCGCGQKAPIAKYSMASRGWKQGFPVKFIRGHNLRSQGKGENAYRYKNGMTHDKHGRILLFMPNHTGRNKATGYVYRSRLVAEKALGKPLPKGVDVHHFDEDITNDSNDNLVVCESRGYHIFLHHRTRAYRACGHANWRKCPFCKEYDDPKNMVITKSNRAYHRICHRIYMRNYKRDRNMRNEKGQNATALLRRGRPGTLQIS